MIIQCLPALLLKEVDPRLFLSVKGLLVGIGLLLLAGYLTPSRRLKAGPSSSGRIRKMSGEWVLRPQ